MAVSDTKRVPDRDGEHGDGSIAFQVTKPVVLDELAATVLEQFGWESDAGLVIEGSPVHAAKDNPLTIWVRPPSGVDLDESDFKSLVSSHKGKARAKRGDVPPDRFAELVAKVEGEEELNDDEVREAVTLLLQRVGRTG